MKEGLVVMSQKEVRRFNVINETLEGNLTVEQAAQNLRLCDRQIYRLKLKVKLKGLEGIIHKNRGRSPANKKPDELMTDIKELYETKYTNFNINHFVEQLEEFENIQISREAVRTYLLKNNVIEKKRRHPKHRSRRERMPKVGMLIQMDTSEHNWLCSRGEELSLIATIDDANNEVITASFEESDTTLANMAVMKEVATIKGIPLSFYVDGASHFKTTKKNLKGEYDPTQIERALTEIGSNLIIASSPQAKGRIERLFKTFQDRLLNEMTLNNIKTREEANLYLKTFIPRFNKKFMVEPTTEESAYQKLEAHINLEAIFCIKHQRVVKNDNTVSFKKRLFQILPSKERLSYRKAKVEIQERLDKSIHIFYKGRELDIKELAVDRKQNKSKTLTFEDFTEKVSKQLEMAGVT